jgi:hypothetical protein
LLDACRGGTVRLHERQAFDKPQRRKPRNTALALRMLWVLSLLRAGCDDYVVNEAGLSRKPDRAPDIAVALQAPG